MANNNQEAGLGMKIARSIIVIIFSTLSFKANAQLSPMKSLYFQNQYLVNPAMAAKDGSTTVFINYSAQWTALDGAPQLLSLSASTPIAQNSAVGLNVISDKAGLLTRTQTLGSYAYKLRLNEETNLRFGVSAAWTQDGIDHAAATSNGLNDPSLSQYNELRDDYWDGNFGAAFESANLELQFTYLSLNHKRSNKFTTADYSTFYTSAAYKFDIGEEFNVKPMVVYRGVNGYKNQLDIAAEWGVFAHNFNLYTMYHSNNSFTGGFGFAYKSNLMFSGFYNSEPRDIRGFTSGVFDFVVGYRF